MSVKSSSSGGSLFDTRILTGTEGQFLDSLSNNYINSNTSIEDASRARTPNIRTRATTSARYIHVHAPPTGARARLTGEPHPHVYENDYSDEDSNYILMDNICSSLSDTPEECGLTDVEDGKNEEPYYLLNNVRSNNIDRPIIAHLNINFLYQKFEPLKDLVNSRVYILVISETKVDNSFPMSEFEIEGYSTHIRLDRNCHGGDIILYVRSDLPCKELNTHYLTTSLPNDVDGIFAELTIRKTKWLFVAGYNNKKENIANFLSHLSKGIDKYICNYENLLILGDFNISMSDDNMNNFCETYDLKKI